MDRRKMFFLLGLILAGLSGVFTAFYQGCSSSSSPSSPTQASNTPTAVPAYVTLNVTNNGSTDTVWRVALLNNSNGSSNYTDCSVPANTTIPVQATLPSGSGYYQVTIYVNWAGYCRQSTCGAVQLTLGSTYSVTISSTGVVSVGSSTCSALSGC